MSTPGPYSGQYFGDYFGDYLGADAGVPTGAMVGAAHITFSATGADAGASPGWMAGATQSTFSATGVMTAAGPQPTIPAASAAGGSRADRARPRIGRFPDLRAPEVIREPARHRRRKREGDWLVFGHKH